MMLVPAVVTTTASIAMAITTQEIMVLYEEGVTVKITITNMSQMSLKDTGSGGDSGSGLAVSNSPDDGGD